MAKTKEQLLRELGFGGWQVVSEVVDPKDQMMADPKNPYGPLISNPNPPTTWTITDGKGGRQQLRVMPTQETIRTPGEDTVTRTVYDAVDVPNAATPKDPTDTKPAKGLQRITTGGVLEEVVDDKGTWSAVLDSQGRIVRAIEDAKPPAQNAPTTKTVNGKTFQWDAKGEQWVEAKGLPAEAPRPEDRPPAPSVNTQAPQIPRWDGEKWVWEENRNYRPPGSDRTPEQVAADRAKATVAQAEAGTATGQADAALRQAQAQADTAAQNLENARRAARQAPTDTQAQQAIQQALQQSNLANQQLEQAIKQAGALNPIAVQQAQATLDRARQQMQQQTLGGDLYGLRDRIKEIKDLLRSGEIDEQTADLMVGAVSRGTTVADALSNISAERTQRRQQDVSNKNQLASTFGSMANQGFSTLADMNKYAAVGSTAGADAFMALLNIAQDRLKAYELPQAPETDFLGQGSRVGALANTAAQTVAQAPPAAQPAATANPAQPITINIGSGAASNPQPPSFGSVGASPTAGANQAMGDPYGLTNALVSTASRETPATNADVFKAFGLA